MGDSKPDISITITLEKLDGMWTTELKNGDGFIVSEGDSIPQLLVNLAADYTDHALEEADKNW